MSLPIPELIGQQATAAWAAALAHALARDEAAGRRPKRLTESDLATWRRFRGRLSSRDFFALLFEDAAVLHAVPFAAATLGERLDIARLPESTTDAWLEAIPALDFADSSADYVAAQARLLGVPTRLARSELHVVKSHQKVLELPGTGGQLAHHLVSSHAEITLQDNVVVACGSWQELTLAGVVALDLAAPNTNFVTRVEPDELRDAKHALRQRSFDFVVGLHPDKGGTYRAEDELAIWFSSAKILLV
jgi:hypothetical protein